MVPDPIQQVLVKELLRPRVDPFSYEISTVQRNKHSTTTIFARGLDRYTLIFASQPYYFVYLWVLSVQEVSDKRRRESLSLDSNLHSFHFLTEGISTYTGTRRENTLWRTKRIEAASPSSHSWASEQTRLSAKRKDSR